MLNFEDLEEQHENTNGKPLELRIIDVMEDPDQPRVEFPELEMEKIAASIKERGVKTPISVKPHPTETGKYIINHGARRYRGSVMAGKDTIPAFIDEDHTDYDQLMENKERLDHSPMEIALFIKKKVDEGEKKGVIAKKLNEDSVYVTTHLALVDMPEALEKAYFAGCKSPKTIYDLRNLFEKFPEQVEAWILEKLESEQEIVRSNVQALAKELKNPKKSETSKEEIQDKNLSVQSLKELQEEAEKLVAKSAQTAEETSPVIASESAPEPELEEVAPVAAAEETSPVIALESAPEPELEEVAPVAAAEETSPVIANKPLIKQPVIRVIYEGKDAELLFKTPRSRGFAWIKMIESNEELEVDCSALEIESILEG